MTDENHDDNENSRLIETAKQSISLSTFLESTPPQIFETVSVKILYDRHMTFLKMPPIKLHCSSLTCGGIKQFFSDTHNERIQLQSNDKIRNIFVNYRCGNCRTTIKTYALHLIFATEIKSVIDAYKYGEVPKFGERVPDELLKYMDEDDKTLFFKGIACQNHGHGIGAVAYFRRVVENIKDKLFDRLIEACKTQSADKALIAELQVARAQTQFNSAVDKIKHALPAGLMIDGHNPITVLHKALSINLHGRPDKECLENATIARHVLVHLAERIQMIRLDDKALKSSLSKLMQEKR